VGSGPELMNGRLAMLAFVAAAGGEISKGKMVSEQLACEPVAVLATAGLIIGGSVITYMANMEVRPDACPLSSPPPPPPTPPVPSYCATWTDIFLYVYLESYPPSTTWHHMTEHGCDCDALVPIYRRRTRAR